jgi:hypothetical protein
MQAPTTRSKMRRKMSLSRKRSLRARENARMIRQLVLDAEATEPAIGEVELHLAAEQAFRANGEHVADDEHPDHQHRINRGAADRRIVWRQLRANPGQVKNASKSANQMIVWDNLFEVERIEQLLLIPAAPPHHCKPPPMFASE